MIISKTVDQEDLLEHTTTVSELKKYVDSTIQEHHRGIKFVEDNQFYYCAMLIHSQTDMNWGWRKALVEALIEGHCAFGTADSFNELDKLTQYANKPRLASLLRKDITP